MRLRSKMKKVRCNGYTVNVYRDPADAFPLFLGNEERQFKAGINILQQASGELSGGNKARTQQLLVKLNDANQSLQADFNAIYNVFASDPCRDRNYLERKIDEIRRDRIHMETLFAHVRAIQIAIQNGSTAEMIMPAIERAFADTMPPFAREAVTLVEEAPKEIERWRQPAAGQKENVEQPREPNTGEGDIIEAEVIEVDQENREADDGGSHG